MGELAPRDDKDSDEAFTGEVIDNETTEIIEYVEQIPNLERVAEHLIKYAEENGLDIEVEDMMSILGEDDNDFLGNLMTIAAMYELDYTDLLVELGVGLEGLVVDESGYLEITDRTE